MSRVRSIEDVVARQLCAGCGACAYLAPGELEMVDALDLGRRPVRRDGSAVPPERERELLDACPGAGLDVRHDDRAPGVHRDLVAGWGPILELWEGRAADPLVRWLGSSGGAATALSLHCIERGGMHGVLHVRPREDRPYLNRTVLSRTREELVAATGSRYAPASPCDRLDLVEEAPGPCAFVGKPCDVAGLRAAERLRPALREKVGLAVAFFCAGTPSTRGTLEMLRRMGVEKLEDVRGVRYRGMGWPGEATAWVRTDAGEEERRLSYEDSWGGILQRHRQWRCYVCPDHTGELADVAVGDPWYRPIAPDEPGSSLVLVRTERGREAVRAAVEAGYLELAPAETWKLARSQPNLLRARGATWGRVVASRLAGAAAPRYRGLPTFRHWWRELSAREKAQSIGGTVKRVFRKGLRRRVAVEALADAVEERPR